MEVLSALLALCEGILLVTTGFPSKRARNVEFWWLLCCQLEEAVEQTVDMPVILGCLNTHVTWLSFHLHNGISNTMYWHLYNETGVWCIQQHDIRVLFSDTLWHTYHIAQPYWLVHTGLENTHTAWPWPGACMETADINFRWPKYS